MSNYILILASNFRKYETVIFKKMDKNEITS